MAFFGHLSSLRKQLKGSPLFDTVFDYLEDASNTESIANSRILQLKKKQHLKTEITNDIFALEQSYETQPEDQLLYEAHRTHIDVHYSIKGTEFVNISQTNELKYKQEYDKTQDYELFSPTKALSSRALLKPYNAIILLPNEAHMTGITTDNKKDRIYKIVVKIPFRLLT